MIHSVNMQIHASVSAASFTSTLIRHTELLVGLPTTMRTEV